MRKERHTLVARGQIYEQFDYRHTTSPLLDVIFHRFTPKKKFRYFQKGHCDYRTQYGARIGPEHNNKKKCC